MASALSGLDEETVGRLVGQMNQVKENLKEQLK